MDADKASGNAARPGALRRAARAFTACPPACVATIFGSACGRRTRLLDDVPVSEPEPVCFAPERPLTCNETVSGEVVFNDSERDTMSAGNLGVRIYSIGTSSGQDYIRAQLVDEDCNELFELRLDTDRGATFAVPDPDNPSELVNLTVSATSISRETRVSHLTVTRTCEEPCELPEVPGMECGDNAAGTIGVGTVLILGGGLGVIFEGIEIHDGNAEAIVSVVGRGCEAMNQGHYAVDDVATVTITNPENPDETLEFELDLRGMSEVPADAENGDFFTDGWLNLEVRRVCGPVCPSEPGPELPCGEDVQIRATLTPGEFVQEGDFVFRYLGAEPRDVEARTSPR
ncbi:MAG TPA: hypothetical protein EYP40_08125 [Chromatiales bacterium]|nr:hypothetical protein [Chromatiales bacterium]